MAAGLGRTSSCTSSGAPPPNSAARLWPSAASPAPSQPSAWPWSHSGGQTPALLRSTLAALGPLHNAGSPSALLPRRTSAAASAAPSPLLAVRWPRSAWLVHASRVAAPAAVELRLTAASPPLTMPLPAASLSAALWALAAVLCSLSVDAALAAAARPSAALPPEHAPVLLTLPAPAPAARWSLPLGGATSVKAACTQRRSMASARARFSRHTARTCSASQRKPCARNSARRPSCTAAIALTIGEFQSFRLSVRVSVNALGIVRRVVEARQGLVVQQPRMMPHHTGTQDARHGTGYEAASSGLWGHLCEVKRARAIPPHKEVAGQALRVPRAAEALLECCLRLS